MSQMNESRTREPVRRPAAEQHRAHSLTPEQRRRLLEMRRRQRRRKQLMIAIPAAVALIAVVAVALSFALRGRRSDDTGAAPDAAQVSEVMSLATAGPGAQDGSEAAPEDAQGAIEAGDAAGEGAGAEPESSAGAEAAATPEPTKEVIQYQPPGGVFVFDDAYAAAARGEKTGPLIKPDMSKVDESKLDRWPKVTKGYMPVVYKADNVQEKVIAITVDDCFQADNLRQIVQCALDNNGLLTIFPIGDNLARNSVAENVKWAWENGMEIENHTYNHVGMYHYDDERMAKEIWAQSKLLNQVLGVNYQEHFFRPKGGDERNDQRVHAFVKQMGMNAIAMWGAVGSLSTMEKCANALEPGQVYLFHTTNKDLELLLQLIPYATQQGYRLVTLNELYGLPANETSDLTEPGDLPALEPFRIVPAMLQKTTYIRAAAVVQKRLIELGWMDGEADGVFGKSSYVATGCFQIAADLKADGKAGAETQAALFADDAPAATKENMAKVKKKLNK